MTFMVLTAPRLACCAVHPASPALPCPALPGCGRSPAPPSPAAARSGPTGAPRGREVSGLSEVGRFCRPWVWAEPGRVHGFCGTSAADAGGCSAQWPPSESPPGSFLQSLPGQPGVQVGGPPQETACSGLVTRAPLVWVCVPWASRLWAPGWLTGLRPGLQDHRTGGQRLGQAEPRL